MRWTLLAAIAVLVLAACGPAPGPWTVEGAEWNVRPWVEAAISVTGDRSELLAAGGRIVVLPDLTAACGFPAYGCAAPGLIYIEAGRPIERSALAHELCHLGLTHGGGYSGPVVRPTEQEADAAAAQVRQVVMG